MFSNKESVEPFWAEYPTEASGRDPLAIQNSSVVIYTNMVVGITNVTNRVRYMGFYCWLFDAIAHKTDKINSLKEQQRYLRRAELLLAYLYVCIEEFKGVTGISGTNFALKNEALKIRLDEGADMENKAAGLYWKFGMGVFGQYYSGAMRDLGLIVHPQEDVNIYVPTDKGISLGHAYNTNIPQDARELFLKSVFSGSISEKLVLELSSFSLHLIPENTTEQKLYRSILLSEDTYSIVPTFHRKNTIHQLLQLLNDNSDGIDNLTGAFLRVNYENHAGISELEDNTATAWYIYEINELLHVAFEHFHATFQYSIADSPTPMYNTINELVEETIKAFEADGKSDNTSNIQTLADKADISKMYEYFLEMLDDYRKKDWGNCLNNAIQTILTVYKQCEPQKQSINTITSLLTNNYVRPGYALEMMHDLVDSKLSLSLREYCKQLLLQAINQHMFSSYQKSQIGQGLVHNYMIEENMAWRIRDTAPGRTSPRLNNAIQYLIDIGLIDRKDGLYTITEEGLKVIEQV